MQQGGAPPYGAPPTEPSPFPRGARLGNPGSDQPRPAEPASPISSRPPTTASAAEPAPSAAPGNFPDEDFGERAGAAGNRWPQQGTLALLQIRSDMDPAFRDATLKGPLWEEVSKKLAGLGYRRSAKKCKEKFENVHKYYKRTKEGRVGRQAGKSYRFFDQLEALHGAAAISIDPNTTPAVASVPAPVLAVTTPITTTATSLEAPNPSPAPIATAGVVGSTGPNQPGTTPPAAPPPAAISFSSSTSSSSASESEEDTEGGDGRKRKRKRSGGGEASRKMMAFFEGLMRQVMERQEVMQQRFLEAMEKREQDRMVREEAWRRQEITRLTREHELLAQERAAAASRDAAVVAFLQKLTGQNIQLPPPLATAVQTPPPAPPTQQPQLQPPQPQQPQQQQQPQPQQQQQPQPQQPQQQQRGQPPQPQQPQHQQQQQPPQTSQQHSTGIIRHHQPPSSSELVPVPEPVQDTVGVASLEPASSRWPKVEVHALINLRSSLDARYQEAGPKGPLWEEISAEMRQLGYNRSAKRCKEKWENINKYFKKVKESNRKRPEDAKTCPYFHQLDALYRQKLLSNTGSSSGHMVTQRQPPQETNPIIPNPQGSGAAGALTIAAPPQVHLPETGSKNGNNNNRNSGNAEGSGGPSNGGHRPSLFEEGASSSGATMKPEDIVKRLMKPLQPRDAMDDYDKLEDLESDDIDEHDGDNDDDDEDDEEGKMQYRVQYASRGAAPATGSFLAMV